MVLREALQCRVHSIQLSPDIRLWLAFCTSAVLLPLSFSILALYRKPAKSHAEPVWDSTCSSAGFLLPGHCCTSTGLRKRRISAENMFALFRFHISFFTELFLLADVTNLVGSL